MVQECVKMCYLQLKPRGTDVLCKLHNQRFVPIIKFLMNAVLPWSVVLTNQIYSTFNALQDGHNNIGVQEVAEESSAITQ